MKRTIVLGLAGVLLAGCAGEGAAPEEPPDPVLASVKIELRWPLIADTLTSESAAPDECAGGMDYSEIRTGSQVTFTDENGKIVGTTDLTPPEPSDNLVICTWADNVELDGNPKYVTAELGGWESKPRKVESGVVTFHLDTVDEHPEFGSEAQVDTNWIKAS